MAVGVLHARSLVPRRHGPPPGTFIACPPGSPHAPCPGSGRKSPGKRSGRSPSGSPRRAATGSQDNLTENEQTRVLEPAEEVPRETRQPDRARPDAGQGHRRQGDPRLVVRPARKRGARNCSISTLAWIVASAARRRARSATRLFDLEQLRRSPARSTLGDFPPALLVDGHRRSGSGGCRRPRRTCPAAIAVAMSLEIIRSDRRRPRRGAPSRSAPPRRRRRSRRGCLAR